MDTISSSGWLPTIWSIKFNPIVGLEKRDTINLPELLFVFVLIESFDELETSLTDKILFCLSKLLELSSSLSPVDGTTPQRIVNVSTSCISW